jgi:hypothetical protein
MNNVIYWYLITLDPEDLDTFDFRCSVTVPGNAQLLSIRERQGDLVAYYRVNDEREDKSVRYFYVVPTGAEWAGHGVPFYDTINVGPLVLHVFCKVQ